MSKYEKRANNCYHQLSSIKKVRKKPQEKRSRQLKSITIEFRTSEERDIFSPFMFSVLKDKGLDKYFTQCVRKGNCIYISTKKKSYVGSQYMQLAQEITESIGKYEFYETMIPADDVIYGWIKLYKRKGVYHIYIGINKDMPKAYRLLHGEEDMIGIREYEETMRYCEENDSYDDEDDDW